GTVADNELGRATADVHHEERRLSRQPPYRAGEAEPRLLVAADDLWGYPQGIHHHGTELVRVAGVPGGPGRDPPNPFPAHPARPARLALAGTVGERVAGAGQRLGGQPPGPVHALAEPDDLHPPDHIG